GFQVDNLCPTGRDIDCDFSLRRFERPKQVLRRGKLLAKRLTFLFRKVRLLLQFGDFVAQLPVCRARVVQDRLEADLFRLFGFKSAQRLAHGIDEPADGVLYRVELANLGIGVEQKVAQRLVFSAKLDTQRGKQFFIKLEQII